MKVGYARVSTKDQTLQSALTTEAGGIGASGASGASGALLIALFAKGFNRHKLFAALLEATRV